ncbi:MAG: DUF134 domain-containing protein [Nitrospirae bacterium]|nr:DUF134 domain-containing protein [Nitrospirota bacterium]
MSRPRKCRHIKCKIDAYYFKPRGIPLVDLEDVILSSDELEAIRLADYEGLYHEKAAAEMQVSRATFGRILKQGRKKVAEALIMGKALKIDARTNK